MNQKEYWNSVSETKQFTAPLQITKFAKHVSSNANIVDVGCGYGRTLEELYQLGYTNLIGIDFSQGMIERGKQQFPHLDLRLKEDARIDLPDHSVDAVILFSVLTCIVENREQQFLISEIRRILKPDGIIYVKDFLLNTDERNLARYQKFHEKYGTYGAFELPEGAILRHHSEEWIQELLTDFKPLEFEHVTFTTMNGNQSNGFYYLGKNA